MSSTEPAFDFLAGGSETGALLHAIDWASTPLGPSHTWPQSLRSLLSLLLQAKQPMYLAWGPELMSFYNDSYIPMVGHKHPAGLGQPYAEMFPELVEPLREVLAATLAGQAQWFQDSPVPLAGHGDSTMRWFSFSWTPVRDEHGSVAGFFCATTETTDKVLAQRRLADERENFAQLFDQAPTFMARLRGPQHRIELANPGYLRLIGHRSVIGKTVAEALPDAVEQGYLELLDRVYATGVAFSAESDRYDMQTVPNGPTTARYVDFVFQPIKDADGKVDGIFIQGVDVTARAMADRALRESEARLRRLNADLEHEVLVRLQDRGMTWQVTPDLLGVMNADGFFEKTNPAWQAMLGWSEDEIRSTPIFELIHPDDIDGSRTAFGELLTGRPSIHWVNRYRCRDGSFRWLSWMAVPEGGKFYCSGRDISAERQAQAELNAAQEALRQAQKMEAVGQLTGGIAHDFNNLLTGIGASLELLEKRLAQGRIGGVDRYISLAQGSTRRAAALTQRLLAFSRRQTLDPKSLDVNRLVAGMEDLIRRTMGPAVRTEVVGAGGLWTTRVDPSQLENALLNLCINARDAMMPAGGRLTIETANKWLDERAARARELPPGQYVSLCVSDTGTGMTPDVISRAFDPFFTTKPLGEGTGLGLSMIYGFVRQSGGQVRVYSEVGSGTTMCIYLPRHLGEADVAEPPASLESAETGAGETVLVVDDEPTVRELAAEVLEEMGYQVHQAADGPSGIKLLQSDARIDLLVTDVGLPGGLNGRQMADAGRLLRPELQVLFITGYAENAVVGNGHLEPGMQVMTKPFELAALGNKVREMIDGRSLRH